MKHALVRKQKRPTHEIVHCGKRNQVFGQSYFCSTLKINLENKYWEGELARTYFCLVLSHPLYYEIDLLSKEYYLKCLCFDEEFSLLISLFYLDLGEVHV